MVMMEISGPAWPGEEGPALWEPLGWLLICGLPPGLG